MLWAILVSSHAARIYFFHLLFLSHLMEGCGRAGFHLNKLEGVGVQEIDTIKQSWISQYNFNVHICTENE